MIILTNIFWLLLAMWIIRYTRKLDNNKVTGWDVILVFIGVFVLFRASMPILFGIQHFTF